MEMTTLPWSWATSSGYSRPSLRTMPCVRRHVSAVRATLVSVALTTLEACSLPLKSAQAMRVQALLY
jgi:hypothetical protein